MNVELNIKMLRCILYVEFVSQILYWPTVGTIIIHVPAGLCSILVGTGVPQVTIVAITFVIG